MESPPNYRESESPAIGVGFALSDARRLKASTTEIRWPRATAAS